MTYQNAREQIENLWDRATPIGPLLDAYRASVLNEGAEKLAEMTELAQASPRAYGLAFASGVLKQMAARTTQES